MNIQEIRYENPEWEEEIIYRYDLITHYSSANDFLNSMHYTKNDSNMYSKSVLIEEDTKQFLNDINVSPSQFNKLEVIFFIDEWNSKVYFFEYEIYYILRIWETSA